MNLWRPSYVASSVLVALFVLLPSVPILAHSQGDPWHRKSHRVGSASACGRTANKVNTNSPYVASVQLMMFASKKLGKSGIDGVYGPNTRDAIAAWEYDHSVRLNGCVKRVPEWKKLRFGYHLVHGDRRYHLRFRHMSQNQVFEIHHFREKNYKRRGVYRFHTSAFCFFYKDPDTGWQGVNHKFSSGCRPNTSSGGG